MPINRFTVAIDQITERIRLRLAGAAPAPAGGVVAWGDERGAVVLQLTSLQVRARDGWLLCNLDVHAPAAAASTLQLLYFLGREGDGDDTVASATVRAVDPQGERLAQTWGQAIQRVAWDGVLDIVEGVVNHAEKSSPGRALSLLGFYCTEGALQVEVRTADAA